MKIGFIGAGNMAQAIIKGLLAEGKIEPQNILVTASTSTRSKEIAATLGVQAAADNTALIKQSNLVILAIKPHLFETILSDIEDVIETTQPLLVSIAAGLGLDSLATLLPNVTAPKIIRAMPNMNVTIRRGVTAIVGNDLTTQTERQRVLELFEAVGTAYELAEKDFRNFTALAGCSPAFTYLYIDAMSRAGVKNGLSKELATKIATEAVIGSAAMVLASEKDTPWDLIDKVCSPGGTTVAGLVTLEDEKFVSTIIKGLEATIKRDIELGE